MWRSNGDSSYSKLLPRNTAADLDEGKVIDFLSDCDEQTAFRILCEINSRRPSVFRRAANNIRPNVKVADTSTSARTLVKDLKAKPENNNLTRLKRGLPEYTPRTLARLQNYSGQQPVVQFASINYFTVEGDSDVFVDVTRIGNLSQPSKVHYRTRDCTAIAGKTYVATSGTLFFERGETEKTIDLTIIDNDWFDTTPEFYIELLQEGSENCVLGRYLWQASVKIADNDSFPTNLYADEIKDRNLTTVPQFGLLFEYFKMNWQDRDVRIGSTKTLILGQLHNLYVTVGLFLRVYLIDHVLKIDTPISELIWVHDRKASLLLLAALLLVPFAGLHFLEYLKPSWKVAGMSLMILQKGLVRRFLHLEDTARQQLRATELILAVLRDSQELVGQGYLSLMSAMGSLGQLAMILLYQCCAPILFKKPFTYTSLFPFATYPILLGLFLIIRTPLTTKVLKSQDDSTNKLIDTVHQTVSNYKIVIDYNRRSTFIEAYEAGIKRYNLVTKQVNEVLVNNEYYAKWICLLLMCLYQVTGGMKVIAGHSLGLFLNELAIIQQAGEAWGNIYNVAVSMQMTIPALHNIVKLMNLNVDVQARMELNRFRRERTVLLTKKIMKTGTIEPSLDLLPLQIDNIHYSYSGNGGCAVLGVAHVGTIEFYQGQMVSLVGPPGQGKSTLLKILGGALLPSFDASGSPGYFIPSHLRLLHVWTEPMFFKGTLLENLNIGVREGDPDGRTDRVLSICRKLGVTNDILDLVPTDSVQRWGEVLSLSQQYLLNFARCIVANFEVLFLHKPTLAFDDETSKKVLDVLKDFVVSRGVEQDPQSWQFRRPRTCVMTCSKLLAADFADVVFLVSREGIKQLEKTDVSDALCL